MNVVISSPAEWEYTESLSWYADRSIAAANDFEFEFHRALELIAATPMRFPKCDLRHRCYLMRRFPFQIIYRSMGDELQVIAIAHASRNPDYWKDR